MIPHFALLVPSATPGTLRAPVDPHAQSWSLSLTTKANLSYSPWFEFRAGALDSLIAVDTAGIVYRVSPAGTLLWSTPVNATTGPASVAATGKLYVGVSDGNVHQLDLATGADEAATELLDYSVASDLFLDSSNGSLVDRLADVAGGVFTPGEEVSVQLDGASVFPPMGNPHADASGNLYGRPQPSLRRGLRHPPSTTPSATPRYGPTRAPFCSHSETPIMRPLERSIGRISISLRRGAGRRRAASRCQQRQRCAP